MQDQENRAAVPASLSSNAEGGRAVRRRRARWAAVWLIQDLQGYPKGDCGGQLAGGGDLHSGVFKPYAKVSTTVLVFTTTGRGCTDDV